ncbi:MAG: hypothetical protein RR575_12745 [Acinetobacter sp.]
MRSWSLFFSVIFASLTSVLSLVIPLCLFLRSYNAHLLITTSERIPSRGIEMTFYLTPFLMLFAFFVYLIILSALNAPKKILEIKAIFKVVLIVALTWFGLIFLFQFLDGMINDISESLHFGIIGFVIMLVPLIVGLVSGNVVYFIVNKRRFYRLQDNTISKYKSSPL